MDTQAAAHGHHHFEKATEVLKQEHRLIEKVLAAVEKLAGRPGPIPVEPWEKAIDFIRNFADKCHHLKEEGLLFPMLEEQGIPREGGPVGMMLMEHEEGRGYVRGMVAALAAAKGDAEGAKKQLVENARAYLRLLKEHIAKEDQILFEMADAHIGPQGQRRLLEQFEEHEREEMGPGVHEKYLEIANELERFNG